MAKADNELPEPIDFLKRVKTSKRFLWCRDCDFQSTYILPLTFQYFARLPCVGCGIEGFLVGHAKKD
jgi:hypothetical protein